MKKKMIIVILTIIISWLGYFGYNAIQKRSLLNAAEEKTKELPPLSFNNLDETIFNYINEVEQQTLIIYFHPECEHCQYEAKQIVANKEQFNRIQILMISPAPLTQIKQFNSDYLLDKIPSLKVLWDKEQKFESYFGNTTFPTVFIYSKQNQLQKKYKGEVKIEAILKHLEKTQKEKVGEISLTSATTNHFIDFNIMFCLFDLGL
tara:strand:+ start:4082 stop:4696 length:615 start_codon:yes stop_codon:yes gene_type:complete